MKLILLLLTQVLFLSATVLGQTGSKNTSYTGSKSTYSGNTNTGSAKQHTYTEKRNTTTPNQTTDRVNRVQKNTIPEREPATGKRVESTSESRTAYTETKTSTPNRDGYTPDEVSKLIDGVWVNPSGNSVIKTVHDTSFQTEAGIVQFSDECAGKTPLLYSEFHAMSRDERLMVLRNRENYCFREFSQLWKINTLTSAVYFGISFWM